MTLDGLIRTQHARAVPGYKDSVHVTFVSLPIRTILVEEVSIYIVYMYMYLICLSF